VTILDLDFTIPLEHPFPGLRPFQTHEAFLFFGRDEHTRQLLQRLGSHRLLAVVGSSGSGKSSLVRAGLIPALQIGHLAETGSRWRIAVMRPGAAPLDELASALHQAIGRESDTAARVRAEVGHTSLGLTQAVQERLDGTVQENLLLVVDQFEELFRFRREHEYEDGGAEASLYVTALLEAIDQFDVPIYVVLTMRSDFLGDCAQFPGLPEALNRSQYLIPRLTRDECREAIAGPLRIAGAAVTPRLLERILNESNEDPDRLPVLQHALAATFEVWKAEGRKGELDLHHYLQAGGIGDALNRHAEAVYGDLQADLQVVAERVFRCLTTTDDGRPVRRPARLNRIYGVVGADDDIARERVRGVVRRFSAVHNSFLAPVNPACPDETVVDISHESLIRNWKRLHDWVRSEAESAEWYKSVASAAAKHRSGDAGVWRNPELSRAFATIRRDAWTPAWSAQYAPGYEDAMAFLGESRRAQIRRTAAVLVAVIALAGAAAGGFWKYRADIEQRDVELVKGRAQVAALVDEQQRAVNALNNRLQQERDPTKRPELEQRLAELEKELKESKATAAQAQVDDPRVKTAFAEIDRLHRDLAQARRERDDVIARQTNSADTGKLSQELQDARTRVAMLEKQASSMETELTVAQKRIADLEAVKPLDDESLIRSTLSSYARAIEARDWQTVQRIEPRTNLAQLQKSRSQYKVYQQDIRIIRIVLSADRQQADVEAHVRIKTTEASSANDPTGEVTATYHFRKSGDQWLIDGFKTKK
jgi:hypothetical protein